MSEAPTPELLKHFLEAHGVNAPAAQLSAPELERDEVLLMCEAGDELSAVSALVDGVDGEIADRTARDPMTGIINPSSEARAEMHARLNESLEALLELKSRAYGKVVAVRAGNGTTRKYRIAQANWSLIKDRAGRELMVVNRLAPVAGILVAAEVGDVVTLPAVGEVEVVALDLLDRGLACDQRDFSKLAYMAARTKTYEREGGSLILHSVRAALNRWIEQWQSLPPDASSFGLGESGDLLRGPAEERTGLVEEQPAEDIALGSAFYTRTTRQQEELLGRRRGGLVIVEGIAGSGKTSVALGRMKVLHDSRLPAMEQDTDRFFEDKRQMTGFVRHAQLVDYLKVALDELHLSGMQVKEFKELQTDLVRQRADPLQLRLPGKSKGKYRHAPGANPAPFEGRMQWLRDVERELLTSYVTGVRGRLSSVSTWMESISDEASYLASRESFHVQFRALTEAAWALASKQIDQFLVSLTLDRKPFALHELARRIKRLYDSVYDLVEDRSAWYWTKSGGWSRTAPRGGMQVSLQPFFGGHYEGRVSSRLKDLREMFRQRVRNVLHVDSDPSSLPPLADWYRAALDSDRIVGGYDKADLDRIRQRLDKQTLSNDDVNLLLGIAQVISRQYAYDSADPRRLAAPLADPRFSTAVFVDEVQDFSELEVFLMATMAQPERAAVTVVGDFKQQLYAHTVRDLKACFPYAQPSELGPAKLTQNKRQTPGLAEFSAGFRGDIGDNPVASAISAESVLELQRQTIARSGLGVEIARIVAQFPAGKSIAVILPTAELARAVEQETREHVQALFRETKYSTDNRDLVKRLYVHFTDARPTKGLEFDIVIAPYFGLFDLSDPLQANAAYVTVSRPRERLFLIDCADD